MRPTTRVLRVVVAAMEGVMQVDDVVVTQWVQTRRPVLS